MSDSTKEKSDSQKESLKSKKESQKRLQNNLDIQRKKLKPKKTK